MNYNKAKTGTYINGSTEAEKTTTRKLLSIFNKYTLVTILKVIIYLKLIKYCCLGQI